MSGKHIIMGHEVPNEIDPGHVTNTANNVGIMRHEVRAICAKHTDEFGKEKG